jgi:hypothetical protein
MNDNEAIPSSGTPRGQPRDKGKLIGAKPPLRACHVWSIRAELQLAKRTRDLVLPSTAICAAAMSWRCSSMMWHGVCARLHSTRRWRSVHSINSGINHIQWMPSHPLNKLIELVYLDYPMDCADVL